MHQVRSSRYNPPYITRDFADVPEVLQEQVRANLPKDETINGFFVIPPEVYSKGFRWELNPLQALVFTDGGILQVFAPDHRHKKREAIWIDGHSVVLIKLKLVLLYGRLEIWAGSGQSRVKMLAEYNTVAHKALSPYLKSFIRTTWSPNAFEAASASTPSFDEFARTSLSFYNGVNLEALQPEEKVLAFAFQPELGKRVLNLINRKIFPKTLAVLTDRQVILLQEDLKTKAHYEWLFTFIPRQNVRSVNREPVVHGEAVRLGLDSNPRDLDVSLIIATQFRTAWESFLALLPGQDA